jgi:hypothetical protein
MYSAGAALRDPAAVFGACHAQYVAEHPKQWHIVGRIETLILAIDFERRHNNPPVVQGAATLRSLRSTLVKWAN